jgi:hypothetical protein
MKQHHKAEDILNAKTPGQQIRMLLDNGHPLYTYAVERPMSRLARVTYTIMRSKKALSKPMLYMADNGKPMLIISTPGLRRSLLQRFESENSNLLGDGQEFFSVEFRSLGELINEANSMPEVKGLVFYSHAGISEPIPWSEVFGP